MKKSKQKGRLLDVFTGIVLGGTIGLYHPLGAHQEILVILAVVLGGRMVLQLVK